MVKKIVCIIVFLIIFIGIQQKGFSQEYIPINDNKIINLETRVLNPFSTKKDPFIASLLSFFWVGTGQIYNEEYYKGSILLFLDLSEKLLFVGLYFKLREEYTKTDNLVEWNELKGGDKALLISSVAMFLITWVYSIYDAYVGAIEYNKHYFGMPSLDIGLAPDYDGFQFSVTTRF